VKDYYLVFSLTRSATQAEVKARYRQLVKLYHPDKLGGDAEVFKGIQEAYAVLGDPAKRRAYDLQSKVREFKIAQGGAIDLISILQKASAGRVPQSFVDQVSPVLERKLDEHGVKARAATAEDVLQALGWLKPKRKKRA